MENSRIDCIAVKGDAVIRMQIKTIQLFNGHKYLPVRKISHNQGEYKVHRYSKAEIDYFIGVDLDTDDLYIVPVGIVEEYSSSVSTKTIAMYKNNFAQLELLSGNAKNEVDDIGESLTGNTEGTEMARRE